MRLEDIRCGQLVKVNNSLYCIVLGICVGDIDDIYTHFICQNQKENISVMVYQLCRFDSDFANEDLIKELVLKIFKEATTKELKTKYCGNLYVDTIKDMGILAKTKEVRNWLLINKLQGVELEKNIMDPEAFVKEVNKLQNEIDSFVKKARKCFEENLHKQNKVKEFKLGEVYLLSAKSYELPVIAIYMKEGLFSYYKTTIFSRNMFVYDNEYKDDYNFDAPPDITNVSDLGFNVYDLEFNCIRMNKYFKRKTI